MIYKSSNTGKLFEIEIQGKRSLCPECSHTRKKKTEKVVSWTKELGYCHHCTTSFHKYEKKQEKEYKYPDWKNITKLSDKAVKWFESRMIDQATLSELKIYSDQEWMPQFEKEVEVICFPFFKSEKLVNIKYRGAEKSFKLFKDAELIFFNVDAIQKDVVIVEGEIDLLSYYTSGIKNVISVPAGAGKNLEYLDNVIELFNDVDNIYLAVDNDIKGLELRDELGRRIGFDKCYIVNFKDCKDANDYLLKYGSIELHDTIKDAKCYPIKGIVKASDIYNDIHSLYINGLQCGSLLMNNDIDEFISWETGRLAIATGIPGHGKSEFIDYIISRLNYLYGWKAAYFTPENYPLKFHYAKMFEKYIGKQFKKDSASESDFDIAYEYINNNIFYIMDEEDYTVDSIIKAAKSLVKSRGVKILVIDPYNKIEHRLNPGESETQYISRFLDLLSNFAKFNDVLVFLVAHPRKMNKQGNVFDIPTLYDISGSANFYNKTDYGFCIYRLMKEDGTGYQNQVEIHWQKIKFKHLGESGVSELQYNFNNGRFNHNGYYDNTNWIIGESETSEQLEQQTECPF